MLQSETRVCQNCKNSFTIDASDFDFYEKIKVPPPTWCPECRRIRRMMWRNERTLYKREDAKTGKLIFSQFSPRAPVRIYDVDFWRSDEWDPSEYRKNYDFSCPFFEQFYNLLSSVPLISRFIVGNFINSDYCMNASYLKNCYLVFATTAAENTLYSVTATYCKDSMELYSCKECELCYNSIFCTKCSRSHFSFNCESCLDVWFSRDCIGCSYCFGCSNLRNKSYYIFNNPYSKEEYFKKIEEFDLGSSNAINELNRRSNQIWNLSPVKFLNGLHNVSVSGNYIFNSKNVFDSYRVWGGEDCKHCQDLVTPTSRDCQDFNSYGLNAELVYECCVVGTNVSGLKFCWLCDTNCTEIQYSILCNNSSNLFGCIGLRSKQYCILNKQYTKEEYERLVPKIIEHMNKMPYIDKKGRVYKYVEFFPPELSPFAYNETIAQEYFPLTKEEALKQGYSWKEPEERNVKPDIKTDELPDHIKDVKDSIIGKVIQCAHSKIKEDGTLEQGCNEQCTTAFKIIEPELQFYRRMNLPLPRLCPNCRHYQRLKQRNPLKLWHRKCMCGGRTSENGVYKNTIKHFHGNQPCPNEFETSYSPDRPEIVYCEKCYLAEVV